MSMYSVWIKCQDGRWYEDPIWTEIGKWFICLDDDDPPELVMTKKAYDAGELSKLQLDWFKAGKVEHGTGGRMFPPYSKHQPSITAINLFGKIIKIPPVPEFYDAVAESEDDSRIQCWYNVKS